MSTRAQTRRTIAAIAIAIITVTTPTDAIAAADPGVQAQIDAYLRTDPGGVQINANEISYDRGTIIVTFRDRRVTG